MLKSRPPDNSLHNVYKYQLIRGIIFSRHFGGPIHGTVNSILAYYGQVQINHGKNMAQSRSNFENSRRMFYRRFTGSTSSRQLDMRDVIMPQISAHSIKEEERLAPMP